MKKAYVLAGAAFVLALFAGCGREEKEEKLTVCVNGEITGHIESLAKGWQEIAGGCEIEFVELVADDSDGELKISRLRTEIMAGEGPDVFWLKCLPPEVEAENGQLFENLEKAMDTGVFLPLDEYLGSAKYIDIDGWNQTVLEAGRTKEGQAVLPLYYRFPACAFKSSDWDGQEIPGSWEEFLAAENPVLQKEVQERGDFYFAGSFEKLADVEAGKPAFTEEELRSFVEELTAAQKAGDGQDEEEIPEPLAGGWISPEFLTLGVGGALEEEQTYFAVPNREGGVTAMVTMFAAINRNSAKAEEAFSFLDFALSDEAASGKGFEKGDKVYGMTGEIGEEGDGITSNQKVFQEKYCKNEKVKTAFEKLNGQISNARFYSSLDRDLAELCYRYRWTENPADREQLVKSAYEKMEMKLAE